MNILLAAGLLLRLVVLREARPDNPDAHFQVIQYIVQNHRLPISNELSQSYHPPLYYLLAAPVDAWKPGMGSVHFLSFVFSALNLLLIRKLLNDDLLIPNVRARLIAFAAACFLPEFVMFSSFISNDSLTALVGTLIFTAMVRYLRGPTMSRLIALGLMVGIGLLTKGTFILTGFALSLLVIFRESRPSSKMFTRVAAFCAIWLALGCYKYVENYVKLNRVIVHNLERGGEPYAAQRGLWKGWQTVYDINVIKLIRRPILKVSDPFSYPLLMYATLWYPHIPESSFEGSWHGYQWVGSMTYALAIVPTIVLLLGIVRGMAGTIGPRRLVFAGSLLLLISNLAVVIAAGIQYDIWWCFQSRLCFQSMLPGLMLFGRGMERLPEQQWLRRSVEALCWGTIVCFLLYFAVEIGLIYGFITPGAAVQA